MGVSTNTCFPRSSAATTYSRWFALGTRTSTASTVSSSRTAIGSVSAGAFTRFASSRARPPVRLTIPAICTPSFFRKPAYASACAVPISPAPRTAILISALLRQDRSIDTA